MTGELRVPLADGDVRLEPFTAGHVEGLRAACAADRDIWTIYPFSMLDEHFDTSLVRLESFHATKGWVWFAVLNGGQVVGMTHYIDPQHANRTVEIGGTYYAPHVRGTGFNAVVKRLMICHALACGFARIEFRIDTRNARSMAAVEKLGAFREGVLRRNRVTWTGYVRDTAVYSILEDEWRARSTAG